MIPAKAKNFGDRFEAGDCNDSVGDVGPPEAEQVKDIRHG
jgi:hypothetical protein